MKVSKFKPKRRAKRAARFTSPQACSDPRVQVQVETIHLHTEIIL